MFKFRKSVNVLSFVLVGLCTQQVSALSKQAVMPISVVVGGLASATLFGILTYQNNQEKQRQEKLQQQGVLPENAKQDEAYSLTFRVLTSAALGTLAGLATYFIAKKFTVESKMASLSGKCDGVRTDLNWVEGSLPQRGEAVEAHAHRRHAGLAPLVSAYQKAEDMKDTVVSCDRTVREVERNVEQLLADDGEATPQERVGLGAIRARADQQERRIPPIDARVDQYKDAVERHPNYVRQQREVDAVQIRALQRENAVLRSRPVYAVPAGHVVRVVPAGYAVPVGHVVPAGYVVHI